METKKNKYYLVNAVERNKKFPKSFIIPNKDDINNLNLDDNVKLIFDDKERMWVKITEILSTQKNGIRTIKKLKGKLNNNPVIVKIPENEYIEFEPKHIIDIMKSDNKILEKDFIGDLELNKIQIEEHTAWVTICNKLQSLLKEYSKKGINLPNDFFNKNKDIKELAILIEKWGYESARLRVKLNDWEKRGVHWK